MNLRTIFFFALAAGFAWWVYDRFFKTKSGVEQHLREQDALGRLTGAVNNLSRLAMPNTYEDNFSQGLRGVTLVPGSYDEAILRGTINN